jgi:hypothetical protein
VACDGLYGAAVMTSVSQFLGFIFIRIYPSNSQTIPRHSHPVHNKNIVAAFSDQEPIRDELTFQRPPIVRRDPSPSATLSSNPSSATNLDQRSGDSFARKLDFWLLAAVMSLRRAHSPARLTCLVAGCGLMYINVCSRRSY